MARHLPRRSDFDGFVALLQVDSVELPDFVEVHDMAEVPTDQDIDLRYGSKRDVSGIVNVVL
jgi:hypothetical protein